jgi:hypothetical protein
MNVIHADQPCEVVSPSIFLAGPTPRSPEVASWRPQALEVLRGLGFSGTVLVPERRDWSVRFDYLTQVEWEFKGLESATVLVFWVPRRLPELLGLTTNVEFGRYVASGRCRYGRPDGAAHTRYLDWLYTKLTGMSPATTLEGLLREAVEVAAGQGG